MKILFIQFSDIHIQTSENSILDRRSKLTEAIRNNADSVDEIFLLITGDTAYSGSIEEYEIAKNFFTELISEIEQYTNKQIHKIFLPGNHDCQDLTKENNARNSLITLIQGNSGDVFDKSILDILSSVQENYRTFAEQFNPIPHFSNELLNVYKYSFGEKSLMLYAYNTSFQSVLHENPGKMIFPIGYIDDSVFNEKADISISCFHHPLHWLKPENRREFKYHIEQTSDVYFTGHEHEYTKSSISNLEDNIVYYVEGDVLQETNDKSKSGFNLIYFDLESKNFKVENYKLKQDKYSTPNFDDDWKSFTRGIAKINNPFELKHSYKQYLNDVGANLSHPTVDCVGLSDIFIFPRLEVLNFSENSTKEITVLTEDSEALIKSLSTNIKLLISGNENIGKTSLLKVIFVELHSRGYVPIFVNGHKIKSTSIDDFNKLVRSNFLDQYISNDVEDIVQLDKDRLVIIIDDFDKISLNTKFKSRFLNNLNKKHQNVIISGNELMSLENIITDDSIYDDLYSDFKLYEIREFGNLLRSKLINKWISLGVSETISDEERIKKLHHAEGIIRTVTGKNLVPNYPIFLLTILQAIEVGSPADLSASTFGYYYQFLIQKSFSRVVKTQDEITSYNNYLSELAHHYFKERVRSIDIKELRIFDLKYRENFTIKDSLDIILKTLIHCNILENYGEYYEFKYAYIYYYFVSRYFSENIDSDENRTTISALCKRVFKSEFANILLFLTHHTKDKFLLEEILSNAKTIFDELEPCRLQDDISSINKLGEDIKRQIFKEKSVEAHREEINNELDISQESEKIEIEKTYKNIPDIEEDTSNLDMVAKLNLAFKTIEILGQILKNNYGKLSNSIIFNLAEETYLLGLRTLGVFFTTIENSTEYFVNQINSVIEERNITDRDKKGQLSRQILFNICNQISYSFIKKVSDSLGTENLEKTYQAIDSKHQYNSIKLIDFAIKLDHFGGFPNLEMRNLKSAFIKSALPLQIMRRMVINYLYLFPTTIQQKQKILSFLDIPIETQRRIDSTSKRKK